MRVWPGEVEFFLAVFSCLEMEGELNKDSISLRPDRQLRKYLQPHCNATKWTLREERGEK